MKNSKFEKYFSRILEMHLNTKFHHPSLISVARIKFEKNKFKNLKKYFFRILEMHLNFIFLAQLVWPELSGRKMKNCKMPNFMKIGLKIKISKKYFWTNYNFWLLNSIPKMNFLSQKLAVQSLVIFNRDYIAKNSKIGIILPKMKNSKI